MIYIVLSRSHTGYSNSDTDFLYCLNTKKVVFPRTLASKQFSSNKVFGLLIHKYVTAQTAGFNFDI